MPDSSRADPDLDLRQIRYFVAVAEYQQFSRAAEVLHIAQPSLSRQIQRLEHDVGARLLDRTPHGATLTEAGKAFFSVAQEVLGAAHQALEAARAAATPRRIIVGWTPGLVVTSVARELRRQRPDAEVTTRFLAWNDAPSALHDRRADAVLARLPMARDGLRVTALYDEPRVVVTALDHPLAARESVTLDDIADEPMARLPDEEWNAFWRIDPRPDGRPAPDGPLVEHFEDKLEFVASGQCISLSPADTLLGGRRPGVVAIPIEGVAPTTVVLATRAGDDNALVSELRRIAVALPLAGWSRQEPSTSPPGSP